MQSKLVLASAGLLLAAVALLAADLVTPPDKQTPATSKAAGADQVGPETENASCEHVWRPMFQELACPPHLFRTNT